MNGFIALLDKYALSNNNLSGFTTLHLWLLIARILLREMCNLSIKKLVRPYKLESKGTSTLSSFQLSTLFQLFIQLKGQNAIIDLATKPPYLPFFTMIQLRTFISNHKSCI